MTTIVRRPDGVYHLDDQGRYHRDGGPAIEFYNGLREWYRHERLHRDDGPARESTTGIQEWYFEGQRHCSDGPAVVLPDGTEEWWRFGEPIQPEHGERLAPLEGLVAPSVLREQAAAMRELPANLGRVHGPQSDACVDALEGPESTEATGSQPFNPLLGQPVRQRLPGN